MKITSLKIRNYRTLENVDLTFNESFTAICGPNDCGKTNVVRVIRALMRDQDRYAYREIEEITAKDNYPKWKQSEPADKTILLTLEIALDRNRDVGLYQFMVKHLTLEEQPEVLNVEMTITYQSEKSEPQVSVKVGEKIVDGLDAQQVLKTLRSSRTVLFHNSTRPEPRYVSRGTQGFLSEISGESQVHFDSMKKTVDRTLKKVAKRHQEQIEELLGRLEAKYHVGLSLPELDLGFLPYNITLGQKSFDVPLDDWGSGTQNRTMILMTLFRARQTSQSEASASKITPIIVVEEPESFLHPSAQAEFGRILQDLSDEFQVQVIVTTHSPYMLSKEKPSSNLLLERSTSYGQLRETKLVDTSGENWMQPFGLVLGLTSQEFAPWKELFFSATDAVMLVEGDTDKEYFELLRDPAHGANQLKFEGEIVSYDGVGALQNCVLLKFIRNTYKRMFVTADLDMESTLEKTFNGLGLTKNKDYAWVGVNAAGKKNIEGLLPETVVAAVHAANTGIVQAATHGTNEEQKSAKSTLKKLYLAEFKAKAKPGDEFYKGFHPLVKTANKALSN
ncbi:MAG TPA: AAA family ATPase [Verrucomicrobiae bacterium]|nr:AAA family ATPase [Verrucomicrobiae bacterium]